MLELSALTVGESSMTVDNKNLHEAQRVTDEFNKNQLSLI
jgi:hypothetical protein